MLKKSFSLLRVLVVAGLVFSLALATPIQAFADDGTTDDPAPEATEAPPADEAPAEEAEVDEAPVEESVEDVVTEEATEEVVSEEATEEVIPEEVVEEAAPEEVEEAPVEEIAEEPAEESIAEVAQALAETDSILVDEDGDVLSLASEEAADVLSGDPSGTLEDPTAYGLSAGATFNYYKSTTKHPNGTCENNVATNTRVCYWDKPIQQAVDDAAVGSTVQVEKGTFTEQVVINKSLTLQGAAGAIIKSPDSALTESVTIGSSTYYPIVFVNNAENVVVTGFTIDGDDLGNLYPAYDDKYVGVLYLNSSGEIIDNTVKGMLSDPMDSQQNLLGVVVINDDSTARQVDIEDNVVKQYGKNGITALGDGLTVNIRNNTVTGAGPTALLAQNGIQLANGATGEITGNTVTNNAWIYSGSGTHWTSSGILVQFAGDGVVIEGNTVKNNQTNVYVYDSNDVQILNNTISGSTDSTFHETNNIEIGEVIGLTIDGNTIKNGDFAGIALWNSGEVTITQNTFSGNGKDYGDPGAAIYLYGDYGTGADYSNDLSTFTISGNIFKGDQNGIVSDDTDWVDATGNYWGCWQGPGHGGCDDVIGNVTWDPYLTVAPPDTDADADGIADSKDNCPLVANHNQKNVDGDRKGDVCDPYPTDFDNDGVDAAIDNCPLVHNPDQSDSDGDGIGNICDPTPYPRSEPGDEGAGATGGGGLLIPVTGAGFYQTAGGISLYADGIDPASIGVSELDVAAPFEAYGVGFEDVIAALQLDIPSTEGVQPTISIAVPLSEAAVVSVILPDGTTLELATVCTDNGDGTQTCVASYTPDGSEGSLAPIFVVH